MDTALFKVTTGNTSLPDYDPVKIDGINDSGIDQVFISIFVILLSKLC